ncbi:MAG: hypothetical protein J5525_02105 [Lachnospiraceae bacterium]|nr:hypothetical protein [Lachnospiraceae bacterium]
MKNQDKIIAIGGVSLIIILAIVAIVLLMRVDDSSSSIIKIKPETEKVELNDLGIKNDEPKVDENEAVNKAEQALAVKETETVPEVTDAVHIENEYYVKATCRGVRNNDSQMAELYGYWDDYKLDAVGDLIRLDRVRMLTNDLSGSDEFFYYGEVDANNVPNGKGLAIYADDTYYFGEWNKGLRSGAGMWLRIYVKGPSKVGPYTGVVEHMYNGQFKNDLPNGSGQEHYTFEASKITGPLCITNAIGEFKNGYYNGEIYIMTMDNEGHTYDWYANAQEGKLKYREENKISTSGKRPVLSKGDDNDHSTDDSDNGYYWMTDSENTGFGIYGLKKSR